MNKLKIIIADDHQFTLNGIAEQVKTTLKNPIIYEANNGNEVLSLLQKKDADILITDIKMPKLNGLDLIAKIKEDNKKIKIIVLSYIEQFSIYKKLGKMDIDALILKTDDVQTLNNALNAVCNNERYISPQLLNIFAEDKNENSEALYKPLTEREKQVLFLLSEDKATKKIADELHISQGTVETYRKSLKKKLNANTIAGIISKAYQYGILG